MVNLIARKALIQFSFHIRFGARATHAGAITACPLIRMMMWGCRTPTEAVSEQDLAKERCHQVG